MKKISTTKLSKTLNITLSELQNLLSKQKLIYRKDKIWHLTEKGKEFGGETFFSKRYGDFIIWPPNLNPLDIKSSVRTKLINATKIGEILKVSSRRVNRVLAELGWIDKGIKGWNVTKIGKNLGGLEYDHDTGGTYVLWPENILENKTLEEAFDLTGYKNNSKVEDFDNEELYNNQNIRDKWPTPYRTKDGHRVRSRGEKMIDDYLYEAGIVHAYEREVKNIKKKVLSDFYIPARNGGEAVYIEYWGKEDEKYDIRKSEKKSIYLDNGLNLIELDNKHIYSLDDHLPRLLLKFKIRVD